MARLKASIKTETAGRPQTITHRLGEQFAEAWIQSRGPNQHGEEAMTTAKVRIFEDGSGMFLFKRGPDDISIRWNAENVPEGGTEMHANFNGTEGVLVPTKEPIVVSGGNDDN